MDTELATLLLNLIESVGAPYVICFMMMRRMQKRDQLFVKAINRMTKALEDLTVKVEEVRDEVDQGAM